MTRKNKSDLDKVWAEINKMKVDIENLRRGAISNIKRKSTNQCPECGKEIKEIDLGARMLWSCGSCGWKNVQKV